MRFFMALTLGLLCLVPSACRAQNADATKQVTIVSRDGKEHVFHVELALTPQQQAHGLMGRTQMAEDAGMLFVFPAEGERSFWMKNTLIPLDMLFIKKDGTIMRAHDAAKPNDLTSIKSNGPALAVLEINGGVAKKLGIMDGDSVRHPFFGNVR
jgi:hypothetical protein